MAKRILQRRQSMIPSAFVIRALTREGRTYHCTNCGERMFVQYESGLCPLCFNGRRAFLLPEPVREVPPRLALVGVIDDPVIEEISPE